MNYRNWAGLPQELLSSIAELLPIPDLFRFSATCKSWDAAAKDLPPRLSSSSSPWLALIPSINDEDVDAFDPQKSLVFFNSSDNHRHYRVSLPDSSDINLSLNFLAHRDGWIVFYDDSLQLPILLNPITRVQFHLPSFDTLPFDFRGRHGIKVFLPTSPSHPMLAFVAYGGFCSDFWLAFAKPGDERWSIIRPYTPRGARPMPSIWIITDVQFHQGRFCALPKKGPVVAFDLPAAASADGTPSFCPVTVFDSAHRLSTAFRLVSVPSTGDLLQVRMGHHRLRATVSCWLDVEFDILKFNSEADEWVEVTDLGDQSLLLDWYGAMLLSSGDIPGLRANCIYFANPLCHSVEEKYLPIPNVRVYQVGNMTEKKMCITPGPKIGLPSYILRSMWFMPSLMKHGG